jgi:hypothetical protein
MARAYEKYQPELKGSLMRAFQESNPAYWEALQNRPQDIERVREVIANAERELEAMEAHYQETRQERIAQEAADVWEARERDAKYMADPAREVVLNQNSILEEARKRTAQFHEFDKAHLITQANQNIQDVAEFKDRDGTFRKQEEIERMSEAEKETHIKAEIHAAKEKEKEAKFQARKLFASQREQLIETARENGSKQPEQEVSNLYKSMLGETEKQFHRDVHEVFQRYGWDYDKQQVEFYANPEPSDFEQEKHTQTQDIAAEHDIDMDVAVVDMEQDQSE